ncbi:MAG: PAS domain-containing protein, partial [Sphingomonadales bacterium]|nr:PAS domain-containing protein [Sphingomonadales bacterium]
MTFQQSVLVVLILSGLLVLPVGVYFLNRTITRPVENLVICADELRKGDPHNLQAFTGTDEFSKLAHAFQDMATAVHAREGALYESQESLENAQRIAGLGNWEWDIHTGSVHYSDEVFAILARTHSELNNNFDSFIACVHKDDVHSFKRRISEAMETGAPFSIEHRVVLPDASERFVIQSGEVHIDEAQGHTRITATLQDITERHMLERAKSELISTVSHELRTPLTSILGTLGLAIGGVMGELPDQLHGMLATADKNAKRLSALIDDLLDIEKISGGSMHFEFSPITVASIIRTAQAENQAYAKEFNASIRINGDIPDGKVYGDSDRL